MAEVYSVLVVQAHPSSKRPYASTRLYHCATMEEATKISEGLWEDFFNDMEYEAAPELGSDVYVRVGDDVDADNAVTKEHILEHYFDDAYMEMAPFEVIIQPVVVVDHNLNPATSKHVDKKSKN